MRLPYLQRTSNQSAMRQLHFTKIMEAVQFVGRVVAHFAPKRARELCTVVAQQRVQGVNRILEDDERR